MMCGILFEQRFQNPPVWWIFEVSTRPSRIHASYTQQHVRLACVEESRRVLGHSHFTAMCNLIAHTPTAAWSGNLTQVGSFHTSRCHGRLAEFTPLGATAGWLKLATQVIGASSSRHRHDDPRAAKLARECVRNQGADEHPNQERRSEEHTSELQSPQ